RPLARPQAPGRSGIRPILGRTSAGGPGPVDADPRRPGRGTVFLARLAADPAGGPDHSVSRMAVLSRRPVSLGFSDSHDPDPGPDPAAGHLPPPIAGRETGHRITGTGASSRIAAGECDC